MRILYCNKYNFTFSGTEAYLFEAMDLVRAGGHEAALFSMADPRGEPTAHDRHFVPLADFKNGSHSVAARARLAARSLYSWQARRRLRGMIAEFRPDVAHVRNIYHHLSPSILWELKAQRIPVVYHLNDFKLLCPSYNLVAQGQACERCSGGKFWHVMTQRCYSGPRGSATLLAAEAYLHKWLGSYRRCVDCFLAPSRFVKQKLVENGWPAGKIEILPHFQRLAPSLPLKPNAPVLYFGRLSPEKGVADLLHAMHRLPGIHLRIAGDGEQRTELEVLARRLDLQNVEFLGHLRGIALEHAIDSSCFTVLPSRAYETFGKSILESYAHGRPVVATDLGSRRELIRHEETGLLFPVGDIDRLAHAISVLANGSQRAKEMGAAGRELVRTQYTPGQHYAALMRLYQRVTPLPETGLAAAPVQAEPRPRQAREESIPSLAAQRPKVAFIGGRGVISKYSGIETYFEEAGPRLADMGYDVTVYCRSYFTPEVETYRRMHLVRLPTLRSKHFETAIHTFLSTVHALFQGYDIVHYQALGPALFSFLPRLLNQKTVVTVQGLDWQRKKWGAFASAVLQLGERAAVSFPNSTIAVSRTLQQHLQVHRGAQTSYVPNGTTLRKRRKAAHILRHEIQPDNYILFLGRFSPEKNCHLLIEAYEKIDTPVKLVIAGGSSLPTDAYACELRAHRSDKVLILDWIAGHELDELITNAMLFVLPSDLEGLSLALLDAMGAGVCTLTSDIPENRELVDGAGFSFHPGDARDLETMLRLLIASPSLRRAAAKQAQKRVREHYLWPQVAEQVDSIYQELMAGKGAVRRQAPGIPSIAGAGENQTAA